MTRPVKAAILSFTELDTDQHHVFNEWHRYDHQPEQFTVEGIVAATRVVATPDLLARRHVTDAALVPTKYFGYYLISDPVQETFNALGDMVPALKAQGRWYERRRGPSVGNRLVEMYASPNIVSAPAAIPFRPHQGIFVTVDDPKPTASTRDLDAEHERHEATNVREILKMPGVAGCWSFEHLAPYSIPGTPYKMPERRAMRVYWLHGSPDEFLASWDALVNIKPAAHARAYTSVFAGAYRFIPPDSKFDWFD